MSDILELLPEGKKNFIFVGEAGSGKTETAIDLALALKSRTDKDIHFFDMDQTKPLFRSRDAEELLKENGIILHYQQQTADAPTMVGGVPAAMEDRGSIVIMDVGGNDNGSRLVGGFSKYINAEDSLTFFMLNPYRPWSLDAGEIDATLTSVLGAAHIDLGNIKVICDPNVGATTTAAEAAEGYKKAVEMIGGALDIDIICARREIADEVEKMTGVTVFPLALHMRYEWDIQ